MSGFTSCKAAYEKATSKPKANLNENSSTRALKRKEARPLQDVVVGNCSPQDSNFCWFRVRRVILLFLITLSGNHALPQNMNSFMVCFR